MAELTPQFVEGMFYAVCQKQATNTDIASILACAKSAKDVLHILRKSPKAQVFLNQFHGLSLNWLDHLYCIGERPSHFQASLLANTGINRFVDLTEIEQDYFKMLPDNVSYCKATIANDRRNGPDVIEAAAKAVLEPLGRNERVYMHCMSGISRSIIIASIVMAVRTKSGYLEAMKFVKTRRPIAQPQMDLLALQDAECVIRRLGLA